jgi:hypothetical protein
MDMDMDMGMGTITETRMDLVIEEEGQGRWIQKVREECKSFSVPSSPYTNGRPALELKKKT